MKLICDREKLLAAFQTASSFAPSRSPKAILNNIKLDVSATSAVILATDLEVGIRVAVPNVTAEVPGAVVLPIQRFGSILRENSDANLRIETDGQVVQVRGERSEFKLPSEDPEAFPNIAEFNETRYHELPARLFREMIRRTAFATDAESSRYALGGVLLEMSESKIIAVGTDGRRLATMEGPAQAKEGHSAGEGATIVPTRAMHLLERAIADADAEIRIAARGSDMLVWTPRMTLYARLAEGRYPKWRDVFPRRTDAAKISLPVGPLYASVRQAAIVTDDESRGVNFQFASGNIRMAGSAAKTGQSCVDLPVSYEGETIPILMDPRYLMDFLKVLDPEKTFTMEIKDSMSAAVCSTDDGYRYVIMPLSRDR